MQRKINIFIFLFWIAVIGINAQVSDEMQIPSKIYSDRITDQDGNPLSGIQVRVRGKGISTFTDSNGEFSINAKNGDIIILSKNGRRINTYRLDGSIYYEVEDESDQVASQKNEKKSMRSISKRTRTNSTVQFKTALDSAIYYKNKNSIQSVDFVANALNFASGNNQISQSYIVLGDVYMNLKQYDLAVSNYKIAVDNSKNNNYELKLAKAFLLNNEYQKSEDKYNTLLKKRGLTTIQKVEIYEGLGDVYTRLNQHKNALNQYRTALTLNKRTSNINKTPNLNAKVSSAFEAIGETEKAEGYLLRSQTSVVKQSPQKSVIESQRAADFYSRNKNVAKEVKLRQEIVKNLVEADVDEVFEGNQGISLSKPKAKLDLGNAYLKQQNFKEAIPILEESAAEAEITDDIETQKNAVQKLSEAYVFLGNDEKALSNYKKYVVLVDAIYKQKENEINEAVSLSKDLSTKQNRITSLEKDRELSESKLQLYKTENQLTVENDKRQKTIIYALLAGLILLLLSLFWMLRSNKQRRLANNLLSLKSLRTQMNPHFIFNALNSVNSFIAQNDERTANRYLTDFSTLMRSVLENSEEDFIPLEKEVELLDLYLKLEHSRFKDKFDYEFLVDDTIELSLFQIPPMLLQPYVENAVWHGLRYKKEKGFLKVQLLKKDKETLLIEISDNGIGRKKSKELKTDYQKKKKSKGMQNIKQRIAILNKMYKDKVDVFIEDMYDDETGTKVVLTLKKD
ncbi:MAG: histidine kinase [Flavobacteriaceae bacterium]|nr:histidine kinase [Flavobacteriaceae bacterium]